MPGDEVLTSSQYRVRMGLEIPAHGTTELRKRAAPERDLQVAAVELIEALGVLVFAVPNGGFRDVREAARMRASGTRPGVPDLVLVFDGGRCGFLEMKALRGSLSDAQEGWRDALLKRGHVFAECRTLDEVERTVRHWLGIAKENS